MTEEHGLTGKTPYEIFDNVSRYPETVKNNAGGHYNHDLFWKIMSPEGGGKPGGRLAGAIDSRFGSFESFKEEFNEAAVSLFGSGWVWLCLSDEGKLFITSTPNQDNPLMDTAERKGYPLFGLDLWEHAYYLKYQNRRSSFIEAFWKVINWPLIESRFEKAAAGQI